MTDEELIDRVITDLSRLRLIKKEDVCLTMVQRTEFAYVINDLDYNNNLSIVKKYFDEIGIALVGRFAEYKYLNMDACVQSAFDYVKKYRKSSNS
jgi:protoporphyrinogen oxidase